MTTNFHKRSRRPAKSKPAITEARLRQIIRDELSRQVLVQEGFLDSIRQPFKKLGAKAKKWVLEKSAELAKKVSEASSQLKVPEDMKEFLSAVSKQEGGVSLEEMVKMVPGLAEGKASLEKIKEIDFKELAGMGSSASPKSESYVSLVNLEYLLSEERHAQRLERTSKDPLNESVVLGALSAWYTFSKTVVTSLSLVIFLIEGAEKITKLLGMKKASGVFKKIAHFLEKIEEWFVSKAIFPAPVQYAAYLALAAAKKVTGKTDKVMSFKEFQSPENKETKEKVIKGLKIALLCVIVAEALAHIVHALDTFFHDIAKSAKDIFHAGEHAGIEGKNIAKAGAEISKTSTELRAGATGLAGGTAAASQV